MAEFDWGQFKEAPRDAFDWQQFEEQPQQDEQSLLSKVGHGAAQLGTGALQGLAQTGHALGSLETALINKLLGTKLQSPKPDIYSPLGVERGLPAQIGEVLPALLAPEAELGVLGSKIGQIPKVGQYLHKGLQQALPQAGYAGAQQIDESPEEALKAAGISGAITAPFGALGEMVRAGSPVLRKGARVLGFLGGGALGEQAGEDVGLPKGVSYPLGILSGYLTQKGLRPKTAARRAVFGDVEKENLPKALERLAAGKRIGLDYMTPAEAFKSPTLAKAQSRIGRTEAGSQKLIEAGEKRVASEEKAINNVLDKIYNEEELGATKAAQYKELLSKNVPDEFVQEQMTNPIVGEAIKRIERNPAYQKEFENVPKTSMAYWDQVKKIMQKDLEGAALRKGEEYQAKIIGDTRREMVNQLDKIYPDYENARNVAQRQQVRKNLEKAFDKKDITGNNFFKAIQSEKKFNELMKSLKNVPEAQERLKDMRLIFNDLISPPSVRTAAALERTSMTKARDAMQGLVDMLDNVFRQSHDKAAVDLLTSPNWQEDLTKILGQSNKSKAMRILINSIGKASAQAKARESRSQQ